MLFNSLQYAVFLPLLFIIHWLFASKSLKRQNFILIFASYFFYAFWDYRFLFLLLLSTLIDYGTGLKIADSKTEKSRKVWLSISLILNLGLLGYFKYFNFFIESFTPLIETFGFKASLPVFQIILPVGISFYTFHGLSYVIDIYKRKIQPTKDFVEYSLFVCFFPLLVAGPIERATHLLPQLKRLRVFEHKEAVKGLKQILWGLFKKLVIADNCAEYANYIFDNYQNFHGSTLLLGAIFFAFQIYGDFSGYSDIAIGTANLFGIELFRNFSYPYFSRDIAEFWRRWHLSLTSWFRDYVYIPLGGSKGTLIHKLRNVFIIFIISGFWHGANYTFIAWGALNALYFVPLLLLNKNRDHKEIVAKGKSFPSLREAVQITFTFLLVAFAWIFFRSTSIENAFHYISNLFSGSLFSNPFFEPKIKKSLLTLLLILFFQIIEWKGREDQFAIENALFKQSTFIRWSFYSFLIFLMGMYMNAVTSPFIYFQF